VLKPETPQPESTAVAPKPPEQAPATKAPRPVEKPAAKAEAKAAEPKAAPSVEKSVAKAEPKAPEKKPQLPASPIAGEQFIVQVGAFASPDKVREITDKLKDAKLAHYAESVATAKGPVTRIRLGPYASKETAEKARDRAKALGLSPANPSAK
jgi:DedD protein